MVEVSQRKRGRKGARRPLYRVVVRNYVRSSMLQDVEVNLRRPRLSMTCAPDSTKWSDPYVSKVDQVFVAVVLEANVPL